MALKNYKQSHLNNYYTKLNVDFVDSLNNVKQKA